MEEIKKIEKPFIRYIAKVIPLAFDESMSYYETLCNFYNYLVNEIVPTINTHSELIEELQKYVTVLKDYIDNYFENLDIQTEINNKLDEMALDGTLADIINIHIFDDLNNDITVLSNKISEATLNHIVNELPETLEDNNEYSVIKSENEIEETELPNSYYENYYNCKEAISDNLSNGYLTVATFNIENENVPYSSGLNGINKLTKLQNIYNKLNANIIGLNEVIDYDLFPSSQYYCTENLTKFSMGEIDDNITNQTMIKGGNAILSNLTPVSSTTVEFTSQNPPSLQGYIKNVYSYNNNIISFYCTHLCYNSNAVLQDQLAELYSAVGNDTSEYKIIVGDFNFDLSEYETYLASFLSSGYQVVNGGQYKTYDDSRDIGVDEIMVSSNINIISSGAGDRDFIEGLSDHFPVYATIDFE